MHFEFNKIFQYIDKYIFTFKHDNRGNPIVTITNVLFYDLLRKRRLEVEFNGDIFMADMMPSIQLAVLRLLVYGNMKQND